ncbi:Zn-dependent hydrolase [Gemmatimonas sp.]|jgi:N-carbamoyl-L-amino-acid hydrolase|uniref:Zn-dependent hydrolase n=1 Tax=Gemmatimonas sp. TaxID=1962908 RepID=UPI0022C98123|nr:Zn-dependent hydrolase [Gemmatimonas sp.]MCZ8205316.1 Zn-dependent hydrolase [Gemmatimonas sp.]
MIRRHFVQQAAALAALPALSRLGGTSHVGTAQAKPLVVNGARLNGWLTEFDRIGRTAGGINRVAYSEADLAGRAFTRRLFEQSGLTLRLDTAGNMLARVPGSDARLSPILIGSHIDSVTDGGNFDGPVGSFAAIEVARSLAEQKVQLRHPLEVVVWQNEEGGTIGSKIAVGLLTPADLDKVARSGKTVREGIGIVGGDVSRLNEAVRKQGDIAGYIELHIEQGGLLEKASRQIGVVEGIVGLRWFEITITGFSNHAGATPMDQRQDAMLAAAKFTVAVNDAIRSEGGRQVATVGRLNVTPNTTNVIPGQVVLTVDLRDLEQAKIDRFTATFERLGREIGAATNTAFAFSQMVNSTPALSDARIMDVVQGSATALGLSHQRMPSGAGHDAQEVAHIAPMGMIFIPSVGGISHSPKEFSRAADITNGANVLLNAVVAADRALG